MSFSFWQLKTTVYVLFLASCLGQELFGACVRDNCYERSVEGRTADANDLRERYLYGVEILKRGFVKAKNRHDDNNQRINEIDERRVTRQNFLLRKENRGENIVLNDHRLRQAKSDVTRHLDDKSDERREVLRQLEEREFNRRTVYSHGQPQTLRHLDERVETKLERLERYETLRRFDRVRIDKRSENKREESRENTREQMENRKSLRITSEHDDNQEKRYENPRQLDKPKVQRDDMRRLVNTRQSERMGEQFTLRNRESRQHRDENKWERVERDATFRRLDDRKDQCEINRRSENNNEEREDQGPRDGTKRSDDTQTIKEQESTQRSETNKLERVERDATLRRFEDRQGQHEIRRYSEDNREKRHDTIRQLDEPEILRDFIRRSDDTRANKRVDERISYRERDENKCERVEERQAQRDVSRRTEDNSEERHETLRQVSTLKSRHAINERHSEKEHEQRLDDRQAQRKINRSLADNRVEHHETLSQLIDRDSQRADEHFSRREHQSSRRSEDKREERYETLRQFNGRDVSRSADDTRDERLPLREINSRQHRDQNKLEREGGQSLRRLKEHQAQREISRHLEDNREERRETLRQLIDRDTTRVDDRLSRREQQSRQRDENKPKRDVALKRLEDRQDQREISRRSENNREDLHETFRQLSERDVSRCSVDISATQRIDGRLSQREQESTQRLDEDNRERVERSETLKLLDDREVQRYENIRSSGMKSIQRRVRVERDETLRPLEDRQAQYKIKRLSDEYNRVRVELFQRKRESTQRRDENKREQVGLPESLRRLEVRENQRHENRSPSDNREERHEILRQLDEREVQRDVSRRSDDTRENQLIDERLFQRERESIQHSDENKRERIGRHESLRRLNDREVRRLEARSSENQRQSSVSSLRQLTERDDRLYQREHESRQQLDENKRERRLGDSKSQRDTTRLLNNNREINRRSDDTRESQSIDESDENKGNDDRETQRDTTRRIVNTRESLRNERETTENRNEREREERHETSRKSINRNVDDTQQYRLIQTERTFILEQKPEIDNRRNHRYIKDDYTVEPTVYLKKRYLFLGQSVILAFVIMRTVIGKDELKHQIPQNIREAVGMMGF